MILHLLSRFIPRLLPPPLLLLLLLFLLSASASASTFSSSSSSPSCSSPYSSSAPDAEHRAPDGRFRITSVLQEVDSRATKFRTTVCSSKHLVFRAALVQESQKFGHQASFAPTAATRSDGTYFRHGVLELPTFTGPVG